MKVEQKPFGNLQKINDDESAFVVVVGVLDAVPPFFLPESNGCF